MWVKTRNEREVGGGREREMQGWRGKRDERYYKSGKTLID